LTKAAKTLKVGLLEKNVTSDQIIKTDMIHENKAAPLNISGLSRHFQYLEIHTKKEKN
jgi:hypothetical protein